MTRRALVLLAAAGLLAAAVAGCGGTPAPLPTPPPGAVAITAQGNAFIPAQVTAPADAAFTLFLVNKDGEPHNAHIWDAAGTSVFAGEHFTGPAAKAEQIPALAAGTYRISCDIHPDMTGQLVAQ